MISGEKDCPFDQVDISKSEVVQQNKCSRVGWVFLGCYKALEGACGVAPENFDIDCILMPKILDLNPFL